MHGLDKAARNREPQAGAGADMVALLHAIEFVKYTLQLRRRNAVTLVEDLQGDPIPFPQTPDEGNGIPPTELRSEEHTSELQSLRHLVCRLLLVKQQIIARFTRS